MSRNFRNQTLRHRHRNANTTDKYPDPFAEEGDSYPRKPNLTISVSYLFYILVLMVAVMVAVILIEKRLPPGLKLADGHHDRFLAERARNYLHNLTSIGPRIAGSYENEVLAVRLLTDEIQTIIDNAKDIHVVELDVQKTSGAFSLDFLDGLTVAYHEMQNVVVKIGSRINSPYSLLINCHFDSVMDSPGASDDGAGCAVMLEILNVLTQSDRLLKHNIIFLFNGAEENFLPASHGFITQHKWAKEVQAFINLEACGAGGREVLFQAGPNHPWILETYSEEVPYPYASSLAQEIFQSGIIPGETDYRIFRDFGHISGLDFAWSANGYVYHTKFDSVEYIPLGSLQRTGDNILSLARGMASGHQLASVEKFRAGNLVFFDFLGAFVIRWSEFVSNFVNVTAILFSLYTLYMNKRLLKSELADYYHQLGSCIVGIFLSWILAVLSTILIALVLNVSGRTMSWFARPIWVFFLYICPTILVPMVTILLYSRSLRKRFRSCWSAFQMYYDAYQLIWTAVLAVCVALRIRSGFIPLLWVVFPSVGNYLRQIYFGSWKDGRYLFLHVAVMGLPFTQCFYLLLGALYLFIPIMGRAGAGNNSELIIAVMVGLLFSLQLSFVTPLVLVVRNPEKIFSVLLCVFLISVAVLMLTPFGFPYSGDPHAPAPQRFMIAHTRRTFHDENNETTRSNGYWIVDLDINSPHSVDHIIPEMAAARLLDEDCERLLYCGQAYLVPVKSLIWVTHWLEGPEPVVKTPATMQVINRTSTPEGEAITFNITGPDHLGVMMSPTHGVTLQSWSVTDEPPIKAMPWNDRDTYFIYFAYGLNPVPFVFTINLQVPFNHRGPTLDIAVTSHQMHGEGNEAARNKLYEMTISVDAQLNYLVQWFREWSELQRADFLPVLAEKLTNITYVNGIVNSIAGVNCQDKPMSLFECRVKLFREWVSQWNAEQRERLAKQITDIDPSFGEKLNAELQNGVTNHRVEGSDTESIEN